MTLHSFFHSFLKIVRRGRRSHGQSKNITNARRDWKIMLSLFSLGTLMFAVWSVYLFLGIRSGTLFVSTETPPLPQQTLERETIEEALTTYEIQRATYDALLSEAPVLADPSE